MQPSPCLLQVERTAERGRIFIRMRCEGNEMGPVGLTITNLLPRDGEQVYRTYEAAESDRVVRTQFSSRFLEKHSLPTQMSHVPHTPGCLQSRSKGFRCILLHHPGLNCAMAAKTFYRLFFRASFFLMPLRRTNRPAVETFPSVCGISRRQQRAFLSLSLSFLPKQTSLPRPSLQTHFV